MPRKRFDPAKLSTENIRKNLVRAALFLAAYELMQFSITEGVKGFLCYKEDRKEWDEKYRKQCIERGFTKRKYLSDFYRCCYWLIEQGALSEGDLLSLDEIHQHRKDIAHRLPHFLVDTSYEVRPDLLMAVREYIRKIDVWFAKNDVLIDLSTGDIVEMPEQEEEIRSGKMAFFDLMLQAVLDDL